MSSSLDIFSQLMEIIEDRRDNPPERSYTTALFEGGVEKIGGKITEEAAEVVEAAYARLQCPSHHQCDLRS